MRSLEVLYEADGLLAYPLPTELENAYGGTLGFPETRVFANFVSSLDGVVAIQGVPRSAQLIRGESEADRLVMGLLRACADALVVGASTFRGSAEAHWTAESIYRPAEASYGELRAVLGRPRPPELAVVTASGLLDPVHPALVAGALVLTTDHGAERLATALPPASTLVSLGEEIDMRAALDALRSRGHRLILSEGGPTLLGSLLDAGLLDELFLTLSPVLAGRHEDARRLSLVEDAALLPDRRVGGELLGVRREGAHLFLRYALASA
jgi:riboflavin biosynthesis pyrimidine reductase